ncbi:MAG: serine/threonine-protein phosphatase [Clostridiales bacterium]|jgi:serine/threonine protein phosphatase PrpC|nr:serine/threonine-protein phosphatase [Clostridiales bacterium]MDR2751830.1 serine/threonine-protein phosphatase [Clostridiales bacterium]
MNYHISASTDVGIRKSVNQDSLFARALRIDSTPIAFAAVCDGMGGYALGEVASASVINALTQWMQTPENWFENGSVNFKAVESQWTDIVRSQNSKIRQYSAQKGVKAGTTATVFLSSNHNHIVMSVGDTRAYEISNDRVRQISKDQTYVQREVDLGHISPQEARTHPKQNVLLQCIGILENVVINFWSEPTLFNSVYMLCSDGFRHVVTENELLSHLHPSKMTGPDTMQAGQNRLIDLNKARGERDNISVLTIKPYLYGGE